MATLTIGTEIHLGNVGLDQSVTIASMPRFARKTAKGVMVKEETASDLVRKCAACMRSGTDFPTVWNSILKGHALVVGRPVQMIRDGQARLEIFLVTGQRLIFDSASKEFTLS